MKRAPVPSPLLIAYCKEPTGKRGHVCPAALRQGKRHQRPVLVVHLYRQRRRGADFLLLPPPARPFSPILRQTLEGKFPLLELTGWLLPGGLQVVCPWRCEWKMIARPILEAFVAELTALVATSDWPAPKTKEDSTP